MKTRSALFCLLPAVLLAACASSHAEPVVVSADDRADTAPDDARRGAHADDRVGLADDDAQRAGRVDARYHDTRYDAPRDQAVQPVSYPYDVEITDAAGRPLRLFHWRGRSYVLGTVGARYRIHIRNQSSRRVEAVVSIDGLDAVDGRTADFVHKRGYLVPAYGDITIDGFRTSLEEVATFRFSSVRDSYAGRKGQDRNVGVIGVAFFPERPRPPRRPPVDLARPLPAGRTTGSPAEAPRASAAAPSPGGASAPPSGGGYGGAEKSAASADRAAPAPASPRSAEGRASGADARRAEIDERPGLGTEFGERRDSHVEFTTFQRESPTSPAAVFELHYDDRAGLLALGIPLDERPPSELERRETADPFPLNSRFAEPPPAR